MGGPWGLSIPRRAGSSVLKTAKLSATVWGLLSQVTEWDGQWGAVAHVWNVLWALTIAHGQTANSDGFDYSGYAKQRWARYLEDKA